MAGVREVCSAAVILCVQCVYCKYLLTEIVIQFNILLEQDSFTCQLV